MTGKRAPRVISERNLDTSTLEIEGSNVRVKIAEGENMIEATDSGLRVNKPNTIKLVSLGGVQIGDVIVD